MIIEFKIEHDDVLKNYLIKQGISKRLGKKIKLYGKFYLNNIEVKNYAEIKKGDLLRIELDEEINDNIPISTLPIDIVYEDDYLLIINKPLNLSVHPSIKHYEDNLLSRLKNHFLIANINSNPHIVNRLDYATSGLLVVAKNGFIHHQLTETSIDRKYLAKVHGLLKEKDGILDFPIERDPASAIKRMVRKDGLKSITKYQVIKELDHHSILNITLVTGRTHQIRVHLSHLGHPIVGDVLYGNEGENLYLHSYYLKFIHPITKQVIEWKNHPQWFHD